MTKSRNIIRQKARWTPAMDAEIVRRYPHEPAVAIASDMGLSLGQVYNRAWALGIRKTPETIARISRERAANPNHASRAYRFKKGQVPANKGLRRPGWAPGNMAATQFKKGQMPHNTHEIGSHRLDPSGILQRKISNAKGSNSKRWRGVHELVWVAANGPVPARHIVVFKKGMRTNVLEEITLDRVECISLAENMRRNTFHNYGPEVAQVVQLRGAITRQINKREGKKAA